MVDTIKNLFDVVKSQIVFDQTNDEITESRVELSVYPLIAIQSDLNIKMYL